MLLFDLFMIVIHSLNVSVKVHGLISGKEIGSIVFILFIVFYLISYFQYKDRFNDLKRKWNNETSFVYRRNG